MFKVALVVIVWITNFTVSAEGLRVVTEALQPYQIVHKGKLVGGSSFLVVKEMLKRAGVKTKIDVLPWARAYAIAVTEPDVLIFSLARNQNREDKFQWLFMVDSHPYAFYALTSQQNLQINTRSKLLENVVVSVRDSHEASSLITMGFVEGDNLVLTRDYRDAWHMVELGRADLIYASEGAASIHCCSLENSALLFSKVLSLGERADLYIAASVDMQLSILSKLKSALLSMQQDGTAKSLLRMSSP